MGKTTTSIAISTSSSSHPSTTLTGSTALHPDHQRSEKPTTTPLPTTSSSTSPSPSPSNTANTPNSPNPYFRPHLLVRTPSATPPPLNPSSVKAFFQRFAHHIQATLDGVITLEELESTFFSPLFATSPSRKHDSRDPDSSASSLAWWLRSAEGVGGLRAGVRKCHLEAVEVEVGTGGARRPGEAGGTALATACVTWTLYHERNGRGRGDGVVEEVYWVKQGRGEEMRICGVGVDGEGRE